MTNPQEQAEGVKPVEVAYEVWQTDAFGEGSGDMMVACSTSLADANHYAAVYGQDGPAWVVEVTRRRMDQPDTAAQPVAWMYEHPEGHKDFHTRPASHTYEGWLEIPLYAHPPAQPVGDVERDDTLPSIIKGFWLDLCEKDDRTSPEEYPDMCLITSDELVEMLTYAAALSQHPDPQPQPQTSDQAVVDAIVAWLRTAELQHLGVEFESAERLADAIARGDWKQAVLERGDELP